MSKRLRSVLLLLPLWLSGCVVSSGARSAACDACSKAAGCRSPIPRGSGQADRRGLCSGRRAVPCDGLDEPDRQQPGKQSRDRIAGFELGGDHYFVLTEESIDHSDRAWLEASLTRRRTASLDTPLPWSALPHRRRRADTGHGRSRHRQEDDRATSACDRTASSLSSTTDSRRRGDRAQPVLLARIPSFSIRKAAIRRRCGCRRAAGTRTMSLRSSASSKSARATACRTKKPSSPPPTRSN